MVAMVAANDGDVSNLRYVQRDLHGFTTDLQLTSVCVCAYIHIYIYIYICMCMYVSVYLLIHLSLYVFIHLSTLVFRSIYLLTYSLMFVYVCVYVYWLVVSSTLKNMKVSWDDDIPNIRKNKIHVPNHQPD